MSNRDDMVIVLQLGEPQRSAAPVKAREERVRERTTKGGRGLFRRLSKAEAKRKALLTARRGVKSTGRRFGVTVRGGIAGTLTLAALVVGTRIATGESFETTAERLNEGILGDLDERAAAERDVRGGLSKNPLIAAIVAREGRVNSQIKAIGQGLIEIRKEELVGASILRREFDVEGATRADQAVLRVIEMAERIWKNIGGDAEVEKWRDAQKAADGQENGKGGNR